MKSSLSGEVENARGTSGTIVAFDCPIEIPYILVLD
jgi:hypothetical protein